MGLAKIDERRFHLNKWEMYKALVHNDIGNLRLPFTRPLSKHALMQVLKRNRVAFIKHVDSWGGRDVFILKRYPREYRLHQQNAGFTCFKGAYRALTDTPDFTMGRWIVQRGAPLLKYERRPFDIRVHLQRDIDDSWVTAGMLVRAGRADSLVSNIGIGHGQVYPVDEVLHQLFSTADVNHVKSDLEHAAHRIAQVLEQYREFQEIGLDVGLDRHRNLWLIEVNTDDAQGVPSAELFKDLDDSQTYEQMVNRREQRKNQVVDWLFEALF